MAGNKIQLKRTSVSGRVPSNTDIDVGELAINLADSRLFTKDGANAIVDVHGQSLNTSAAVQFANVTANNVLATTITGNIDWSYVTSKPDLKIDITGDATGNNTFTDLANGSINIALANTAVVAGTYGNSSAIPVITVDSKGRITAASTNTVAGVTGLSYTPANNTLTITAGDGSTYKATIGTVNTFIVSNTLTVNGAVVIANTLNVASLATFSNNVVISGDLVVTGTTTYVNTNIFQVSDNIITLNNDATGSPTDNVGFEVNRGSSPYTYLLWDEAIDKWTFTNDGTTYYNIASNTDVTTAYSNATSYADAKAANAYSNAVSYADAKAANAFSNATSYADTAAATAYTNAVAYAASNSYVNTTFAPLAGASFTGNVSFAANVSLANTRITANGSTGSAGQVLTSGGSSSNVYWATPSGGGGGTGNTFATISVAGQTDVQSDDPADVLTFAAGNNVVITTNASTDTITFAANNTLFTLTTASNTSSANISLTGTGLTANTVKVIGAGGINVNSNGSVITIDGTGVSGGGGGSSNGFGTISVSGQSDVIADQANDALTFVAGSGMTITTNPSGDTITFTSSGGGGSGTGTGTAFIAARDNFTANGTQTAFTLSTNATANSILVAVDGLIQFHTEDYDVSGTTLTFTTAPANNEVLEVLHISGATNYLFQQYAAVDSFSGNGSNTQYTLTRSANTNTAQVYLDGLLQDPNNDYTFSGTTLTFTTAPLSAEAILVYHTESSSGNPHLTSIAGTDTFAGDGTTAVFTLSGTANSATSFVTVNGLMQRYTTDYTLSGTTLTFVDAPPDGAAVQAWRLTGSLGVTYKTIQVSGQSDIVADQADDVLTFANGAGITITTSASTDTLTIAQSAITKQSLTGNGSNTVFTLDTSSTEDNILVFVDGMYFHPADDYTVSGTTLTFTAAPINSAEIRIRYMR
jgi:fibronectin-binding autotransporter adhesin